MDLLPSCFHYVRRVARDRLIWHALFSCLHTQTVTFARLLSPYQCTSLPHRTRENTNPRLTQRTGHATLSSVRVHQSAASAQLKKNSDPTPGKVKKSASVTLLTEMRGVCANRVPRPLFEYCQVCKYDIIDMDHFLVSFYGPNIPVCP